MRAYFQNFFKLLIPITGFFIVGAIIYFNLEYNLNQSLSIGVLVGVLVGIITSLIVALFIPAFTKSKYLKKQNVKKLKTKISPLEFLQTHKDNRDKTKGTINQKVKVKVEVEKSSAETTNKKKVTPLEFLQSHKENKEKSKGTTTPKVKKTPPNTPNQNKTVEHKIMLLMERDLAFEVALYAITEQNIGVLTENTSSEELIIVKNKDEVLQLAITPLTRHTSQVIVTSIENSMAAKKIMRYMKEKEYSFLKY